MVSFFKNPNYNFIGNRRKAFIVSLTLILIGIISIIAHGGLRYGVDFTGGNLLQVKFEKTVDVGKIRSCIRDAGIKNAEIQSFGEPTSFLIRYQVNIDADKVVSDLSKTFNQHVKLMRNESVGPRVGKELQRKAFWALVIGLLLMLIYISFRFDFYFGMGSVIALFHDVFITVGIFSLLNKEFTISIVAALLTIVGYSINDSIVISDRIREERKKYGHKVSFERIVQVFNKAINDTLSRTIITSLTTLVVLISILIFGGPVIFDFALSLTIGVIVGTYSSIFVVAALVIEWQLAQRKKKTAQKA